jgi:hypothetical protein
MTTRTSNLKGKMKNPAHVLKRYFPFTALVLGGIVSTSWFITQADPSPQKKHISGANSTAIHKNAAQMWQGHHGEALTPLMPAAAQAASPCHSRNGDFGPQWRFHPLDGWMRLFLSRSSLSPFAPTSIKYNGEPASLSYLSEYSN